VNHQIGSFVVGVVSLMAVVLCAHTRPPQEQPPVFKSAANHVLVDVIATDKDDKPVTDLTVADFEIRKGGVLQAIADFEHVSIPVTDRKIDLKAPLPPPPDAFTNAPPPPNARAFVFVMWSLSPANIVPIKRMMTSFISALQPVDEVAIVYARRSDLSQDFTSDEGKLIRAVNNLNAAIPGGGSIRDWLFMMNNVLRSLAAARDSRHVIVFISEGFPNLNPASPEVAEIFREAVQRNIPVYTMDPRGLMAPPLGLEGHLEDQRPDGLERIRSVERDKDGLRVIALNTNGRSFVNNWNVPRAAAGLIGDNNSYYLLGFYPSPYEADGKFHDIDVRVTRPGVKIRAREGYRAEGPPSANAKPPRLVDSLGAGLPGGELQFRATAAPLVPGGKGVTTLLTLEVAYPEEARGADRLDLVWIAIDPDGRPRASGQNAVTVDLVGPSPRVMIYDAIDLPRGLLTVRVALSSRVTKTNGTVHIPVEVRNFTKNRLDVAPLVVSRSPAPSPQHVEIGNALRLAPVTPTTARVFSRDDRLRVVARVFSSKDGAVNAEMSLTLLTGQVRALPVLRSESKAAAGAADYVGDVSLRDLPPGRYVLAFSAGRASSNDAPVQRATTFDVK
jgi:VWFA-related protein